MAYQRKYKFNWLDHLYYMGEGRQVDRWPMPFDALVGSILLWIPAFSVIFWTSSDKQNIIYTLCIFVVIIIFYERPLKKYWFTPERGRAYFSRYPQRKHISTNTLWWLSLTIYLTNIVILGLVLYYSLT